ncbi:MAG: twin-arginine translocase subunit TatC [Actinomycetes bacterium]|jgi:sec-independent protein translocase protein TatC|nr:twin-arginine translocase subunit TatC [Actinomycetes bacterium]
MPITPKRMPFLEHFGELRRRITVCVLVLVVITIAFYFEPCYRFLSWLLLHPVQAALPADGLKTFGPFEAMTLRFQIGFYGALVVTSPLILYELFAFLTPAFKQRERRWIFPTVAAAVLLFLAGIAFSYFVILPKGFEWLAQQGGGVTTSMGRANDYFSGIALILIGFGVSFELPLAVFYLIGAGVLPYYTVRDSWRVAYVVMVIVASIATPDWSPYPMIGLSLALIALFEGSLFAAKLVFGRRIAQQAIDAYEDQQAYDNEPTDDKDKLQRRAKLAKRAAAARAKHPEPDNA